MPAISTPAALPQAVSPPPRQVEHHHTPTHEPVHTMTESTGAETSADTETKNTTGERKPRSHLSQRRRRHHRSRRGPRPAGSETQNRHPIEGEDIYSKKKEGEE